MLIERGIRLGIDQHLTSVPDLEPPTTSANIAPTN